MLSLVLHTHKRFSRIVIVLSSYANIGVKSNSLLMHFIALPVCFAYLFRVAWMKCGSSSISPHLLAVFSAAISVVHDPPNGSRIASPCLLLLYIAFSTISTGFCVGCM